MKRTLFAFVAVITLTLLFSCNPSPGSTAGGQMLKDFQPAEFILEGLSAYLSGEHRTGLSFTDSFASGTTGNDTTARASENGTLTVDAIYDEYRYQDYIISGTFVYELPIENGVILGYRVNSDSTDPPTITDTSAGSNTVNSFAISMGDNALAPAYGTLSTSGEKVVSKSGTAAEILPGTDIAFTIGNDTIGIDDIPSVPYSKDQMPGDYLTVYQANLPITTLIYQKIIESGSNTVDLGNGNVFTMDTSDPQNQQVEISIKAPMHFTVNMGGTVYSVHTTGTMEAKSYGPSTSFTAKMKYNNFASSITTVSNGNTNTIQTKKITGEYSGSFGISGSLTIGNHTYSGAELQEMIALEMASLIITSWGTAEIDADGSYYNNLNSGDFSMLNITGQFDSASNTLTGTLTYSGTYPLEAKVSISGSTAIIQKLTFNGYEYSDEALDNLKKTQELIWNAIPI